ncbi:MAG: 3D domain-containing protein [Bacillota bacterium]
MRKSSIRTGLLLVVAVVCISMVAATFLLWQNWTSHTEAAEPEADTATLPFLTDEPFISPVKELHQVSRLVPVEFDTRYRDDPWLERGMRKVVEPGQPGVEEITYNVKVVDGQFVRASVVGRQVVVPPKAEVVAVGIAHPAGSLSRDGATFRYTRALDVTATAYCPCEKCNGKWADGVTATGLKVTRGVIAVDPRVIRLGSRVYVEGYGYAIAGDVGSAIKGLRIDVAYDTHEEALAWGRKRVRIYILD